MSWFNFAKQKTFQAQSLSLTALTVILISLLLLVQNVQKRQELRKMAALPSEPSGLTSNDVYPSQEVPTSTIVITPKPTSATIYVPGIGIVNTGPTPTFSVCKTSDSCRDASGSCTSPSSCPIMFGASLKSGLCPGGSECVCCVIPKVTPTPTSGGYSGGTGTSGTWGTTTYPRWTCNSTSKTCSLVQLPPTLISGTYETQSSCLASCSPEKSPTLTPIVVPEGEPFCVNPGVEPSASGTAPFSVVLYPGGFVGGTFVVAGYQWDLTGDGSWDISPTLKNIPYTFQNPGTYNVRMRVLSTNGKYSDVCQTTITVKSPTTSVSTFTSAPRYDCRANGECVPDANGTFTSEGLCDYYCIAEDYQPPTGFSLFDAGGNQKIEINPQADLELQRYLSGLQEDVETERLQAEKFQEEFNLAEEVNEYVTFSVDWDDFAEQITLQASPNEYAQLGDFACSKTGVCLEKSLLLQAGLAQMGIESEVVVADIITEEQTYEHVFVTITDADEINNETLVLDPTWGISGTTSEIRDVYTKTFGEYYLKIESIDEILTPP